MLDTQLQGLIDAVDLAHDERSIGNAIKNFTIASGFDRYAYIHVHADDALVFSDYPAEWLNLYFERRYTVVDPVVTTAKRNMRMFAWSAEDRDARRISREIKQFYSEATDFGIRSGVSIPTGQVLAAPAARRASAVGSDAGGLGARLHSRPYQPGVWVVLQNRRCVAVDAGSDLAQSSHGKSMNVIADLLGIKPRTVQSYLDNARDKLGASNLQQAVRIAMEKKLILERFTDLLNRKGFRIWGEYDSRCWLGWMRVSRDREHGFHRIVSNDLRGS